MPSKSTTQRARKQLKAGKRPTTAAGEFVKEETQHARSGKHPVKSRKQAIAIGLSKARRAGVRVPAPKMAGARKAAGARKVAGARKAAGTRKKTAGARRRPAASAARRAGTTRKRTRRSR